MFHFLRPSLIPLCLLMVIGMATPLASAPAAQIIVAGSIEGTQVREWRTASTAKSMDLDGDGIYGTFGALNWLPEFTGMQSAGSTTRGWAPTGWGLNSNSPDFRGIDSIDNAPADVTAGYAEDYFRFELTGEENDFLGKTVRVGVMEDIIDGESLAYDRNKGLQLVQTFGGSATSPIVQLRFGQGGNGEPEMYFWDLKNVKAGDQFTIYAFNTVGGVPFSVGYVGPVSFDLVPEPGSAMLVLAGAIALGTRNRRVR